MGALLACNEDPDMVLDASSLEIVKWALASLAVAVYLGMTLRALLLMFKTRPEKTFDFEIFGNFKVLMGLFLVFYMQIKFIEALSGEVALSDAFYAVAQMFLLVAVWSKLAEMYKALMLTEKRLQGVAR